MNGKVKFFVQIKKQLGGGGSCRVGGSGFGGSG